MDYNDLLKIIKGMTKVQRKTEVVVFEEGTSNYIWPASLEPGEDPNRPYLEGIAAEGERDQEFFDPAKAKGTRSKDVDSVEAHPTELDSEVDPKPDRIRAPKPTSLDRGKAKKRK